MEERILPKLTSLRYKNLQKWSRQSVSIPLLKLLLTARQELSIVWVFALVNGSAPPKTALMIRGIYDLYFPNLSPVPDCPTFSTPHPLAPSCISENHRARQLPRKLITVNLRWTLPPALPLPNVNTVIKPMTPRLTPASESTTLDYTAILTQRLECADSSLREPAVAVLGRVR
ncbi:hypothetical protein J6590_023644 [Homalodisca vitripennis]|nr:hypothetical protein J6590_023644 [Homalodisca vitripennis]